MTKLSPLSKKVKVFNPLDDEGEYKFEILFNEKAELININYPVDLSLEKVNNHFAVAMLYLAQKLVEGE